MKQQKTTNFTSNLRTAKTSRTTEAVRFFKILGLVLGGVLICTSPFWCEPFRYQKEDLALLKEYHANRMAEANRNMAHLRSTYEKGHISKATYIANLHNEMDILEGIKVQNQNQLDKYRSSIEILEWQSTYIFLLALGTRIPILIFPFVLVYLFKIGVIEVREPRLRTAFFSFIASSLAIGIFWMAWVFWPFNELPFNAYLITIVGSSLLLATAITNFVLWRETKFERFRKVIHYLNSFIKTKIPERLKSTPINRYEEVVWDAFKYQENPIEYIEDKEGEDY